MCLPASQHNEQKEEAKPTEKQKLRQEFLKAVEALEEKSSRIIKKLTAAMDQQISNAKRQLDQEVSHRRNIESNPLPGNHR